MGGSGQMKVPLLQDEMGFAEIRTAFYGYC
jgi:hypothetical protein